MIIKIRFVCFQENEVGGSRIRSYTRLRTKLHARSCARSHNHSSRDHGVIIY